MAQEIDVLDRLEGDFDRASETWREARQTTGQRRAFLEQMAVAIEERVQVEWHELTGRAWPGGREM